MATPQSLDIIEYTKIFKDKKITQIDLSKLLNALDQTKEPCEKCKRFLTLWHLFGSVQRMFENPLEEGFPKLYHATSIFVISPGYTHGVDFPLKQQLARAVNLASKLFPYTAPQCQALTVAIFDPWINTHPSELNEGLAQQLFDTECPEFLAIRVEALYRLGLKEQARILCMRCLEHYLQQNFLFPPREKGRRIRPHVLFLGWKLIFDSHQDEDGEGLPSYLCKQVTELTCHEGSYLLSLILEKCPENSLELAATLAHVLLLQELLRASATLCCTRNVMQLWLDIALKQGWGKLEVEQSVQDIMMRYATVSSHLYLMVDVLYPTFREDFLHLYLELYVRALTSDRNHLEVLRDQGEPTEDLCQYMAEALSSLAMMLPRQHAHVAQQCAVTAFSQHPTESLLHVIHYLTRSPPAAPPPPPDCNCGGRCLTPTREVPLPQYSHPCPPHYILDAAIRAVSYQLLVDLTALLEGLTSHLLPIVGTWREIGSSFNDYLRAFGKPSPSQQPEVTSDSESDSEVAKKVVKNDPRINIHLLSLRRKSIKLQIGMRKKDDAVPSLLKKQLLPPKKKLSNNELAKNVNECFSLGSNNLTLEDSTRSSGVDHKPSHFQQHHQLVAKPTESQLDTSFIKKESRPTIITTVITKNHQEPATSRQPTPDPTGPPVKVTKLETWAESRSAASSPSQRGEDGQVKVVNTELKRKEEHLILKRIFGSDFDSTGIRIQQSRKPLVPLKVPIPPQQPRPAPADHSPGVRDKPYKYVVPIPTIKKLLYQANHTNKLTLGFVVKDSNQVKKVEFPISSELARQLANKHSGSIIIEPNLLDKSHRIIFSPSNRSGAQRSTQVKASPPAASPVSSPTTPVLNLTSYKMSLDASSPPSDRPQYSAMLKSLPSVSHTDGSQLPLATDNSRPLPPYSQIKLKNSTFFTSPTVSTTPPTNHQSPPAMVPQPALTSSSYNPAPQSYEPLYSADSAGSQGVDLSLSFRDAQNPFFDSPQQQQQQPDPSLNQLVGYDSLNFATPQSSDSLYHPQPATPDSSSPSQAYQYYSSPSSSAGYPLEQPSPTKPYYPTKPTFAPQGSYEEPAKKSYLHPAAPAEPQYYSSPPSFRQPEPTSQVELPDDSAPVPKRRRSEAHATCALCGSTLCSVSSLKRHLRSVHKNQLSPEALESLNQNTITPDGLAAKLAASAMEAKRNYETVLPTQSKPLPPQISAPPLRPNNDLRNPEPPPQAPPTYNSNYPAPSDFLPYVEKPAENKVALQVFSTSSNKPLQCYMDQKQASQMEDLLGQLEKMENEAVVDYNNQQQHFNSSAQPMDFNTSFDGGGGNSSLMADSYMAMKEKTVAYKLALQRKIMLRNKQDPPNSSQQPLPPHPMTYQTKL